MTVTATSTTNQPVVSAKGKAALDELLAARVDSGLIPSTTFGATTAAGPIYFAAHGERVLGEPDKGKIDDTTRESSLRTVAARRRRGLGHGMCSLGAPAAAHQLAPTLSMR